MDIEREIKVRDAIKYCIENFDSKTATNRIVEFWKEELERQQKQYNIANVIGSLRFSEREVDFAYLCGVFNASGIDGLHKEIQRLKELGKEPHDIIDLEEFKSNMLKLTGADEVDITYESVDENEYEEEEEQANNN